MEKIGKNTSFFEIGGDSITAIQFATLCGKADIHMTSAMVFKKPTLSQLALSASTKISQPILQELIVRYPKC
jgi:hypothetical protein